jgi:hypothetical protein
MILRRNQSLGVDSAERIKASHQHVAWVGPDRVGEAPRVGLVDGESAKVVPWSGLLMM